MNGLETISKGTSSNHLHGDFTESTGYKPEAIPVHQHHGEYPQYIHSTFKLLRLWGPIYDSGQLVYEYHFTGVYGAQITMVRWGYKPTYNWGPHIVDCILYAHI